MPSGLEFSCISRTDRLRLREARSFSDDYSKHKGTNINVHDTAVNKLVALANATKLSSSTKAVTVNRWQSS